LKPRNEVSRRDMEVRTRLSQTNPPRIYDGPQVTVNRPNSDGVRLRAQSRQSGLVPTVRQPDPCEETYLPKGRCKRASTAWHELVPVPVLVPCCLGFDKFSAFQGSEVVTAQRLCRELVIKHLCDPANPEYATLMCLAKYRIRLRLKAGNAPPLRSPDRTQLTTPRRIPSCYRSHSDGGYGKLLNWWILLNIVEIVLVLLHSLDLCLWRNTGRTADRGQKRA